MAYIIDDTFFKRDLEIPNVDEINSKALTTLNQFIDEKCRLFMRDCLGTELFQELDALLVDGLLPEEAPVTDPITPDPIPAKWRLLVDGGTYVKNDVTLIWDGLRNIKGTYKTSVLAYYTYYYWLENEVSYMAGVGEVKGNPKGGIMVNSTQRLTNVWNKMVELNQADLDGFTPHWDLVNFGSFDYYRWNNWFWNLDHINNNNTVSLMQFLTDNSKDFPYEYPRAYEIKNQLGI